MLSLQITRRKTTIQFVKYALMGVSNTVLDFTVYLVLTRFSSFFGMHIFIAKGLSFFVAATWSFFGNKRFTFDQSNQSISKQLGKYYVTALLNGIINVSVHYVTVTYFNQSDITGIIIAAGITVLFGFMLNKWWVFSDPKKVQGYSNRIFTRKNY